MDSIKYLLIAMLATAKKSKKIEALPYQGQHLHYKTIKIVLNQLNSPILKSCKAQGSEMEGQP